MTTASSPLVRSLLIYSICLPLAVILGYMLANPLDPTTFGVVGLVLFLLLTPALLRWHHTWLIATWNAGLLLFFLPGRPSAWLALVWLSLFVSTLQYILNRKIKFLPAGPVVKPLIFLTLVVIITARCTGGIGMQVFGGSTFGGRRYLVLFSAIAGFFALTAQRIPPGRAMFFVGLYFVGEASSAISELSSVVGPSLYFIFLLFPPTEGGLRSILNDPGSAGGMERLGSL